jgi:hypothetical protein
LQRLREHSALWRRQLEKPRSRISGLTVRPAPRGRNAAVGGANYLRPLPCSVVFPAQGRGLCRQWAVSPLDHAADVSVQLSVGSVFVQMGHRRSPLSALVRWLPARSRNLRKAGFTIRAFSLERQWTGASDDG